RADRRRAPYSFELQASRASDEEGGAATAHVRTIRTNTSELVSSELTPRQGRQSVSQVTCDRIWLGRRTLHAYSGQGRDQNGAAWKRSSVVGPCVTSRGMAR